MNNFDEHFIGLNFGLQFYLFLPQRLSLNPSCLSRWGGVGAGGDFLHCILKLKIHFACLSVRLYPMNVKTAEQDPNLCGTSHDPSEGLWKPKITKNCGQTFFKMREKNII